MAGLTLREAVLPDDEPHFRGFIDGLQDFEFRIEPNRRRDATVAEEFLAALMSDVLAKRGKIFVLEDETGVPAGWAVCFIERDEVYVAEAQRTYGLIAELFIEERVRGQSGGKRLIAACEEHFRALGVRQSALGVVWGNLAARGLYGSLGYNPVSLKMRRHL